MKYSKSLPFFCLCIFAGAYFLFPSKALSQAQVYSYDLIAETIQVNTDSTFDVEEHQIFDYQGAFHVGYRSIPLQKVDAITDVSVSDGATGQALIETSKRLNKLEPSSWEKFTTFRNSGSENIEWYYNLTDTTHEWILRYKVHGAVSFGSISDRLYWNIFTDYSVPVREASVKIMLPKAFAQSDIAQFAYRANETSSGTEQSYDSTTGMFLFGAQNFAPGEAYTVDVSWPKGLVSKAAYWRDFSKLYYGYIDSVLALFLVLIVGFYVWWKREGSKKGKGTIVSQYEPPEHLPPAMAEVVAKEKLTDKGLTATIIDLAIRGFVRIEEDPDKGWLGNIFGMLAKKNYLVRNLKKLPNSQKLKEYEQAYLAALFEEEEIFSTKVLRSDRGRQRRLYQQVKKVKDLIYQETEVDTHAFEVGLSDQKKQVAIWTGLVILSFFGLSLALAQGLILVISILVSGIGLWSYLKYNARLNERGRILKEEWLGFKMYPEVAERYRMQKLTPDMFEKYLPYAMIFGVEKEWAKTFESMNLPPPNWYGSTAVYGGIAASAGGGSFSPSGFSASFSSAFTSAFASSGAGGGVAGGGGAGGGGGGGAG